MTRRNTISEHQLHPISDIATKNYFLQNNVLKNEVSIVQRFVFLNSVKKLFTDSLPLAFHFQYEIPNLYRILRFPLGFSHVYLNCLIRHKFNQSGLLRPSVSQSVIRSVGRSVGRQSVIQSVSQPSQFL